MHRLIHAHHLAQQRRRSPGGRSRQRGITLLESLVALIVSALGILGVLGVQMRTLTDAQDTVRRAQAIRLIEDLGERMRASPNALSHLASYASGFDSNTADPDHSACDDGCTPTEQAAYDLLAWKQTVRNTLPLGQANVFLAPGETDGSRRQLGVIISWRANERADAADDDNYHSALDATTQAGGVGNDADNACPADRTCHLQYIPVAARCAPHTEGSTTKYYCS